MEPRYIVTVREPRGVPKEKGAKYSLSLSKTYGDSLGVGTWAFTKEEALKIIRDTFKKWEKHDSILDRRGDKVTPKNIEFHSFTDDITKMELFGVSRIEAFL